MGVKVSGTRAAGSLQKISQSLGRIETTLVDLQRAVSTLQSQWTGDAREAFAVAMADAHSSVSRLRTIAVDATTEANAVLSNFDEFDRRRQSAWPA